MGCVWVRLVGGRLVAWMVKRMRAGVVSLVGVVVVVAIVVWCGVVVSVGVCERCGEFEDVVRGSRFYVECGSVIDLCVFVSRWLEVM